MSGDAAKKRESAGWTWLVAAAISVGTLLVFLLSYALIGERPRTWQYGAPYYVPGESVYSIRAEPPGPPPAQVELPPAKASPAKSPAREALKGGRP